MVLPPRSGTALRYFLRRRIQASSSSPSSILHQRTQVSSVAPQILTTTTCRSLVVSSSSSYNALLRRPFRSTTANNERGFASSASREDEQPADEESLTMVTVTKKEQTIVNKPLTVVSHEEVQIELVKERRKSDVPIAEVLRSKHQYRWVEPVIPQGATIREAIVAAIDGGLSGMMVLENTPAKRIVGLLTTRDLLRIMASGIKEGETADALFNRVVVDYMTPVSQVIYGRPDETVGMARALMAKLRIKTLPILSKDGQHVEGLITARDMSDFGLNAKERGGKRAYLEDVSERVGLSSDTSMAEPPNYLKAHLALEQTPLHVNIGIAALPHPFKKPDGMDATRQDGNLRLTTDDVSLSEDAHFVTTVLLPDEHDKTLRKFTYAGVADGVGSWREYGVDPREFSRALMQESENLLEEASRNVQQDGKPRQLVNPATILAQAYERVKSKNVIGSTTACIALIDGLRHQLHFSNLGDSGLIVLRHIDSDVAGVLKRERHIPRTERKSDMQVAFVSQQQLRSFNHPYQLGWTGDEETNREATSFKNARDSCTSSIHVRRGDIVIMATDGLFDNVDLEEIRAIAIEWEHKHGFIRGGDIAQRERRWSMGNSLTIQSNEHITELSDSLVKRARENSLNNEIDSPFAILAKENDIMWSGGMPDDCTVLAFHIVGRDVDDVMDGTHM